MHTIYNTEGFILKSLERNEANKFYFIFTRDFGLITVAGQGTRLLKSKLRYSLEDFSYGKFSVVRGREIWRLTGAEKIWSALALLKNANSAPADYLLLGRVLALLVRLLHGEERNDRLFDILLSGYQFLLHSKSDDLESFECIFALRILSALGYLSNQQGFEAFTTGTDFTPALISRMKPIKSTAIVEINKSLKETHL